MAHFQERRSCEDRRKFKGKDRRCNTERRGLTANNLELIERARYKAWMNMTDKES